MDKDTHSVIINVTKERRFSTDGRKEKTKSFSAVTPKRTHNRIVSKPSEATLKVYDIPEDKPLPVFQLKNDSTLLSYKFYSKIQDYHRHRKQLAIPIQNKHKILSTNFRQRLHVDVSSEKIKTIIDVDEDFYNCINGRIFKHEQGAQYKSLKINFNKKLHIKQQVGHIRDCVMNIELNQKKELEIYNNTLREVTDQAKYFDQFISEDYRKSMILLEQGDKLLAKVDKVKTELENLAGETFFITSKLIGLDYRYGLLQKYGRFLYYLSPPSWRAGNRDFARSIEIEAKGFDLGVSSDEDTFTVIYEKLRKECCKFVKPALYYTEPKHLMDVFERIEQQQLNHFTHVSHFSPYTKMLKESIKRLKDNVAEESVLVSETITYFKDLVEFNEQRCLFLEEKFFKILHGLFYESVGTKDVLKLFFHLEFCYEKVYAEKPINKDMKAVAESLEAFYLDYSKRLDALRSETVDRAINICVETERRKARNAIKAAKELKMFNILERNLLRAHGLPPKITLPVLPLQTKQAKKSPKPQRN
ncbi:PREDICTED: uncharacterized protein LOC106104689 [Papilio polytes]|uniref:uncharacterized protein LOC106104689 n=1 Tax=Papilio polytes TaxID=76194 RepID=UPI000676A99F|nr:PREDICTED: uncharacterized protein LOC106104689 [Papilio polytes]